MKDYFIIVDLQNDFVTGPLGTPEAHEVVSYISLFLSENIDKYNYVFTLDKHVLSKPFTIEEEKFPAHCISGTKGYLPVPEIKDFFYYRDNNNITGLDKNTFGSLEWQMKLGYIPKRIHIAGLCTDICVLSNAIILQNTFPCTEIIIHSSLCAGTTPENHQKALDIIQGLGMTIVKDYIQERFTFDF